MSHTHAFLGRWRCEHPDRFVSNWHLNPGPPTVYRESMHSEPCSFGRWLYVCSCGETGFPIYEGKAP